MQEVLNVFLIYALVMVLVGGTYLLVSGIIRDLRDR